MVICRKYKMYHKISIDLISLNKLNLSNNLTDIDQRNLILCSHLLLLLIDYKILGMLDKNLTKNKIGCTRLVRIE